ncbi:M4 family metallopeptidase [Streptomyces sp. NPDC050095]|uniref:M4 family metallopeptidase n=1 Tax=unclassified Streptomyces TaxID=2593676 RepID=UPI0034327A76
MSRGVSGGAARSVSAGAALLGAAALLVTAVPAAHAAPGPTGSAASDVVPGTETDTPALVEGLRESADAKAAAPDAARGHLAAKESRYSIDDPAKNLRTVGSSKDGAQETVRFQQRYKGVEVLGGQYVVRMEKQGGTRTVTGTSGQYFTELATSVTPKVSGKTAEERAVAAVATRLGTNRLTAHKPGAPLTGKAVRLVVLPQGKGLLTRQVTVSGTDAATGEPVLQQVYVDAASGFPLLQYSSVKTFGAPGRTVPDGRATASSTDAAAGEQADPAREFPGTTGTGTRLDGTKTDLNLYYYASRGQYTMIDYAHMWDTSQNVLTTWDARGKDVGQVSGRWPSGIREFGSATQEFGDDATQAGAVDAHWAAGQVYDYYRKVHGRDSLDGRGMTINSLVGVTSGGQPYVNAFWDGTKMVYGTGDDEYKPLAADLDVVGHEMTHGVVENTANLVYAGQSGAMNEAIADYFGNAIDTTASGTSMDDPDSGLVGENLCRTTAPRACAFRDMNDGATTSKNFLGVSFATDNGGVHLNSTIYSGALWDIRQDLGAELGDKIAYKALTDYLTPLDGFTQGRNATLAAAKDLGVTAKQLNVVKRSFNAHGIVPGWEQALGVDSDRLLGKINTYATGTGAGGGWYATSRSNDDGSEPFSVWAGRTNGTGAPKLISSNDGNYNVYAATDGKTVAWASFGASSIDLMVRPVSGGLPKKLWSSYTSLTGIRVDGDLVVFEESDPFGGRHAGYVDIKTGKQAYVDGGRYQLGSALPSVADGRIAYGKLYPEAGEYRLGVELLDVATGKTTLMPDAGKLQSVGQTGISAGGHPVWLADEDGVGQMAVRTAFPDGAKLRDLVPETGDGALYAYDLTTSDTAVTVTAAEPDTAYRNETLPKLWQIPADGSGSVQRVSCNRGEQAYASADTGQRVVWIDGTTGSTDLVTRERPAGRC